MYGCIELTHTLPNMASLKCVIFLFSLSYKRMGRHLSSWACKSRRNNTYSVILRMCKTCLLGIETVGLIYQAKRKIHFGNAVL